MNVNFITVVLEILYMEHVAWTKFMSAMASFTTTTTLINTKYYFDFPFWSLTSYLPCLCNLPCFTRQNTA